MHQALMLMALAVTASCSGGGGTGSLAPDPQPGSTVIAEASIGPSGGTISVAQGAGAGVQLSVPAGAVSVPTSFRVLLDTVNGEIPSAFPIYRFEPGSLNLNGQAVTVTVPASEAFFAGPAPDVTVFGRDQAGAPWRALTSTTLDVAARVATATTDRLGDMVVWDGNLHRLFTQPHGFVDPAVDAEVEIVGGVEVLAAEGSIQRQVGRGSMASFWNSPATDNVVILHGALGSPLDFLGAEDLVENLALTYDNVVLFSYPSARGVAYAANELYDQILANRKPGFGCRIIGHSLGALIGRYLLEASPTDTSRASYSEDDPSLVPVIDRLVMMAPPNAGAAGAVGPFSLLEPLLTPAEAYLLQTSSDLSERPDSLPLLMNAAYVDSATRYHVIYGDIGTGTDGVVPVASALALPMGPGETSTLFVAQHDDLHRQATSLGVASWLGSILQGQ